MAQTTRLASFEPVFVTSAQSASHFITSSRSKRGWGLVVRCRVKMTHRLAFVARVGRCRCGRVVVVVVVVAERVGM
jgi:hypothetical protein